MEREAFPEFLPLWLSTRLLFPLSFDILVWIFFLYKVPGFLCLACADELGLQSCSQIGIIWVDSLRAGCVSVRFFRCWLCRAWLCCWGHSPHASLHSHAWLLPVLCCYSAPQPTIQTGVTMLQMLGLIIVFFCVHNQGSYSYRCHRFVNIFLM